MNREIGTITRRATMVSRIGRGLTALGATVAMLATMSPAPVGAAGLPSGERVIGGLQLEPYYDDMTGNIGYLATPVNAPNFPGKANHNAWAPLYLVVYPTGSTVSTTLNCMGVPGNCPDHDATVAGGAASLMPSVYSGGVIGHDHLAAAPGSGGDFNVTWEPVLVLFTSAGAANQHITTLAELTAAYDRGDVVEQAVPSLTFLCNSVPATLWDRATPVG